MWRAGAPCLPATDRAGQLRAKSGLRRVSEIANNSMMARERELASLIGSLATALHPNLVAAAGR